MAAAAWEAQTEPCFDCRHYQDTPRRPGTPPWRVCVAGKTDRATCGSFVPRAALKSTAAEEGGEG